MSDPERIMDHNFVNGYCTKCQRKRVDLVAYGAPDIVIEVGTDTGLSCAGATNLAEVESLRAAYQEDRKKWDKVA